jgi:hypothetical protein
MSEEQKQRIAESNRLTKAAPPDDLRLCFNCEEPFACRPNNPKKFCSLACNHAKRPRRTPESRAAMSARYRGSGNPMWRGGMTDYNKRDRGSPEYKAWRTAVFKRDGYTCVDCNTKSSRTKPIVAHHLAGWADFPRLRYIVENGATVCNDCHDLRHGRKIGRRG